MAIRRAHREQNGTIPQHVSGTGHGDTSTHNRLLVWELLRQRGAQSRSQLSDLTGMSASTLTYAVRDLIGENLVRPGGKRTSRTVGKKQELVEINAGFGHFAGLFLEGKEVSATLIDAAGRELDHRRLRYDGTMEGGFRVIDRYLDEVLGATPDGSGDECGAAGRRSLAGVGFAIPGVVDAQNGRIVQSWRLGVNDYDFAAATRGRWSGGLVLDNDVNLASWAEAEHLGADLPSSLLFVALHATTDPSGDPEVYGAGMGLIEHGRLQSGTHNGAGELDSLRALIGDFRLDARQVARLGDPEGGVDDSLGDFLRDLGRLLTVLVDLVDPSTVILGGSLTIRNRAFYDALTRRAREGRILRSCGDVVVRASSFGERGVATGAAMLARRSAIRERLVKIDE